MSDQVPWEKRFENLAPRWETHEYDPSKYLAHIDDLISRISAPTSGGTRNHEVRQVELDTAMLQQMREFAEYLKDGRQASASATGKI